MGKKKVRALFLYQMVGTLFRNIFSSYYHKPTRAWDEEGKKGMDILGPGTFSLSSSGGLITSVPLGLWALWKRVTEKGQ